MVATLMYLGLAPILAGLAWFDPSVRRLALMLCLGLTLLFRADAWVAGDEYPDAMVSGGLVVIFGGCAVLVAALLCLGKGIPSSVGDAPGVSRAQG